MQWLLDFIAQGGPVLYGILLLCLLLWSLILERLWFFYRELPALRAQLTAHWQQRPEHRLRFGRRGVGGEGSAPR